MRKKPALLLRVRLVRLCHTHTGKMIKKTAAAKLYAKYQNGKNSNDDNSSNGSNNNTKTNRPNDYSINNKLKRKKSQVLSMFIANIATK